MVIATIKMTVPQKNRQELLQTLNVLTGSTRKEPGCRSCDFYMDIEDADAFLLMEEWEGQDEFENHLRKPLFGVLLGALTLLNQRPEIRINTVIASAGMEKIKSVRMA